MDKAGFFTLFVCVFVFLGVVVLWTYGLFFLYYSRLNHVQQLQIWAYWGKSPQNIPWAVSAALSTVAFLCFSARVLVDYAGVNNRGDIPWLMCSYVVFLVASGLYTPLMMSGWHKRWVILDLVCVSIACVLLSAWTVVYMRWSDPFECWIKVGMMILAFHCTILDLCLWGWSWYSGWFYVHDTSLNEIVWTRARTTSPVNSLVSQAAWPFISNLDVSQSLNLPLSTTRRPLHLHLRV